MLRSSWANRQYPCANHNQTRGGYIRLSGSFTEQPEACQPAVLQPPWRRCAIYMPYDGVETTVHGISFHHLGHVPGVARCDASKVTAAPATQQHLKRLKAIAKPMVGWHVIKKVAYVTVE